MSNIPSGLIDAHCHFWRLSTANYPWLLARGHRRYFGDPTPIQRDHEPANLLASLGDVRLLGTVNIEAEPVDASAELRWLDSFPSPFPAAIVAAADLTAEDLDARLDMLATASPRFVGVQQAVARHASEDVRTRSRELLDNPRFAEGLALLATRGLSFELQLVSPLLAKAAQVFAKIPQLNVVLTNLGGPWDQSEQGMRVWREGIGLLAQLPSCRIKLSGFGIYDHIWTSRSIQPLVEGALEAFGQARTMWGSGFPIEGLHSQYQPLVEAVARAVPQSMHLDVFARTAASFYKIGGLLDDAAGSMVAADDNASAGISSRAASVTA